MAFKKGTKWNGNSDGRPKAGNAFVEQLRDALKAVEKNKKKSLMQYAIERAYTEDTVLIAILRKVLPDLNETDVSGVDDIMENLRKRFS